MFKKKIVKNIDNLDLKINKLTTQLALAEVTEDVDKTLAELNSLVELRCKLEENRGANSIKPAIVSGIFGVASIALVMKYEEAGVITSKAFNIATGMIRGSK